MKETFALPAVGAIIVKREEQDEYILVQNRKKNSSDGTDGLLEIPAGKDWISLLDENGFCGFRYLERLFGTEHPEEKIDGQP